MIRFLAFILCLIFSVEARATTPSPLPDVTIAPHRAVYTMSLGHVKNGGNINSVSGKMFFEWGDSCDGWAVQQHLQLHFVYAEGEETDVNSDIVTWESKDGKKYNFNVRRLTDGKETENYKGKATLHAQGGNGKYALPKEKDVPLTTDSLFPSAHTKLIVQKALNGDKFFMRPVFDGSDEEGIADVSAFIGAKEADASLSETNADLKKNPLLAGPGWPVRLAFFKQKTETGEPDYEMNLFLLENGIAKSMQIDYNDFSVTGLLTQLEALPKPGC